MTRQRLAGAVCFFIAAFFFLPLKGNCAGQNPEQFLKEFYTWYITTNEGTLKAYTSDEIYNYVERETIEEVKSALYRYASDRLDYFTKIYDPPLSMSGVTISVENVTRTDINTFIASVIIITTYPSEYKEATHIVVILREKDGTLKIVKCVDILPEA